MKLTMYQVDAFTDKVFEGNPAAVVPLTTWPENSLLLNIAAENNLSETAFFIPRDGHFELRWFTPRFEIDLCGHATMATAHVLFQHMGYKNDTIVFETRKSGTITVNREDDLLSMDFPAWYPSSLTTPSLLVEGLGIEPKEVLSTRDILALLGSREQVLDLRPDFRILEQLKYTCIIVTAPDNEGFDFVTRVFAPRAGIPEDPVTGSAFSTLTPYWAEKLGKKKLYSRQISERGGTVHCRLDEERVIISGKTVSFLEGTITI